MCSSFHCFPFPLWVWLYFSVVLRAIQAQYGTGITCREGFSVLYFLTNRAVSILKCTWKTCVNRWCLTVRYCICSGGQGPKDGAQNQTFNHVDILYCTLGQNCQCYLSKSFLVLSWFDTVKLFPSIVIKTSIPKSLHLGIDVLDCSYEYLIPAGTIKWTSKVLSFVTAQAVLNLALTRISHFWLDERHCCFAWRLHWQRLCSGCYSSDFETAFLRTKTLSESKGFAC